MARRILCKGSDPPAGRPLALYWPFEQPPAPGAPMAAYEHKRFEELQKQLLLKLNNHNHKLAKKLKLGLRIIHGLVRTGC